MGNHDLRRLVNRFGDADQYRIESAKALAAICLLQRATPFIYQGDELAMADAIFPDLGQIDDVWAKTTYDLARANGYDHDKAFAKAAYMTRDHARTPYNWSPDGGFTDGTPWLLQTSCARGFNLKDQMQEPDSVWNFYKSLISLRQMSPQTWVDGAYTDLLPDHQDIYAFSRGDNAMVVINLRGTEAILPPILLEKIAGYGQKAVVSSGSKDADKLSPWAVYVFD
jgi:glycosidase